MSKRPAENVDEPTKKRQKVVDAAAGAAEEIKTSRQLQQILTFQQDAGPLLAKGIRTFKVFLESITYATDKTTTLPQQTILKEYLESQTPKHGEESPTLFLPNLMQTWSFAAQANNDSLQSATSSVLALLLKTISTLIDFRDHGIQLCKTLLQQAQLKIISRALSAPRQKEHIISPSLRLLTEIVSFDGGVMARNLFSAKTFTFDGKILARNLSLWKSGAEDAEESRRRPSVRSNTLKYILANLKFQAGAVKSDILKYSNIFRALFDHLKEDSVEQLREILEVIKTRVLSDDSIPRNNKSYLFSEHNLGSIASIYRHEYSPNLIKSDHPTPDALVHTFLRYVCSEPSAGILRSLSGWYPPGTDKKQSEVEHEDDGYGLEIDLGLSSIDWYDRYHKHVPVRNGTLGSFAQTLRPYANVQECELLIDILRSAPELVADYFFKKTGFAFDPKLTATWIGYSSFLFSVVQLPVPLYCGWKDDYYWTPPPTSIVMENILPQPLNQKVLTRCLNQQCDLITFFALRLLIVAFQKLQKVLASFTEASDEASDESGPLWEEGASRLVVEFTARCPKMKDVIGTFRQTPAENLLQREASLRLLLLYYEVIPHVAFEEKFDISVALADAMRNFENQPASTTDIQAEPTVSIQGENNLRLLELSHLLQIARWTPDTRWWNKPESMKLSPFSTLLKIVSSTEQQKLPSSMRQLLGSITREHGILRQNDQGSHTSVLIASLAPQPEFTPSEGLYQFLDDALARLTKKPIKYQDDMDGIIADLHNEAQPVSLLLMTLVEQWPFAAKTDSSVNIAEWLGRLLQCLGYAGEDPKTLPAISNRMNKEATTKAQRKALSHKDDGQLRATYNNLLNFQTSTKPAVKASSKPRPSMSKPLNSATFAPPPEDPKNPGLHRLDPTTPEDSITSGHLSGLILCLSSTDSSVRRLALTRLHTLMTQLALVKATWSDAPQFYLLLGILTTTASPYILADTPVPLLCTVYAATASDILRDPLHPLYEKICRFHTRGPKWDVERLPSYWTHQILYTTPTESHDMPLPGLHTSTTTGSNPQNPTTASLTFLLTYLYDSLQTSNDLAILRNRGTFEPILACAGNPFIPRQCVELVLKLLWRASWVEGGSTMLITRKGIMAWLGARIAGARLKVKRGGRRARGRGKRYGVEGEEKRRVDDGVATEDDVVSVAALKMLVRRLWETCDREHVDKWSRGLMEEIVNDLVEGPIEHDDP